MGCCWSARFIPPCAGITRFRFRRSADSGVRPLSPVVGLPFEPILARRSCQTGVVDDRRQRLRTARLYLVCDDRPDEFLNAALRGGVDIVQLRIKDGSDAEILAAARRFAAACGATGRCSSSTTAPTWSDAAAADGVHVGQDDTAPWRRRARSSARSGWSACRRTRPSRSTPRRRSASTTSASGPCTPPRPSRDAPPSGSSSSATRRPPRRCPFFAIGGISSGQRGRCARGGSERIAVVRALTDAADPGARPPS